MHNTSFTLKYTHSPQYGNCNNSRFSCSFLNPNCSVDKSIPYSDFNISFSSSRKTSSPRDRLTGNDMCCNDEIICDAPGMKQQTRYVLGPGGLKNEFLVITSPCHNRLVQAARIGIRLKIGATSLRHFIICSLSAHPIVNEMIDATIKLILPAFTITSPWRENAQWTTDRYSRSPFHQ